MTVVVPAAASHVKRRQLWSIGIYAGDSPLRLAASAEASNPVLTANDVSDVPAEFVADPFLIRNHGAWHMFFEVMREDLHRGEIGLATSTDARHWEYQGIVLREWFHLSYPCVFEWDGDFYMIPESLAARAVRLYKAREFPRGWTHVADLLPGMFADATIVRHDDRWWLFACPYPCQQDILRLFSSAQLTGPWQEHPKSPLVDGDATIARPGGRIVRCEGRLLRFTQDCVPAYGTRVRACRIMTLTTSDYQEREVDESPVLGPVTRSAGERAWNRDGMHHVDPVRSDDGRWIAAVDGWIEDETVLGPPDPAAVRTLNCWNDSWPLVAERCPCDLHFQEYLTERGIGGQAIFHFGTGAHHLLGKENLRANPPNEILGITASRGEYDAYVDFIVDHPQAANHYKVLFADIYTLSAQLLPRFDLVTLFHLCEFYDPHKSAYARLNDATLLDLFISRLKPGGRLFFFKDSGRNASAETRVLLDARVSAGRLIAVEDYKSLLVFATPAPDAASTSGSTPVEK
jgi:hypothetical protein